MSEIAKPTLKFRTNVAACSRTRIDSDNDTPTKPECERGCSMLDLDPAGRVRMVVRVQPQESRWLWREARFNFTHQDGNKEYAHV